MWGGTENAWNGRNKMGKPNLNEPKIKITKINGV